MGERLTMQYGDGFFDGVVGEAQNNLSGFINSMAPSEPLPKFQVPDNNWGIQGYGGTDPWGLPNFINGESWGIPSYGGTENYTIASNLAGLIAPPNPPKPTAPATTPSTKPPSSDVSSSPYYATAQQAARAVGYDPAMFVSQIREESGFNPNAQSPKGARGIAQIIPQYHPGVNADDPNASLVYAAQLMAQYMKKYGGDYRWALAAYHAGEPTVDQIFKQTGGQFDPTRFGTDTQGYIQRVMAGATAPMTIQPTPGQYPNPTGAVPQDPGPSSAVPVNWGGYNAQTLVPNQYHEGLAAGYDRATAIAICGPAAAVAFTRAYGRAPSSLRDAVEAARIQGLWDVGTGMHGAESEAALMRYLGVPVHTEQGVDWNKVINEVEAGRPVSISVPSADGGHYLVATGYDRKTGRFEFGQSAGVLVASGGNTQYTPGQLMGLGLGAPKYSIYMDK